MKKGNRLLFADQKLKKKIISSRIERERECPLERKIV